MIKREDYERVEKPNTRGKILGGSSCANYFTWIPGSKATFDDWEEYGGKEWTWDNIVAYLRKVPVPPVALFHLTDLIDSAQHTMMMTTSTPMTLRKSVPAVHFKSPMPNSSLR